MRRGDNMRNSRCIFGLMIIIITILFCTSCKNTSVQNVSIFANDVIISIGNFDADTLANQSIGEVESNCQQIVSLMSPILDDEESLVFNEIKSSFEIEIIEESLVLSNDDKYATVDVKVSYVDYNSIMNNPDNMIDIDVLINALRASESRIEKIVTIPFVLEDNIWMLNGIDYLREIFSFSELEVVIVPDLVDCVLGTEWWYTDDGTVFEGAVYTNTEIISLHIVPVDNEVVFNYTYNVYLDDVLVFESNEIYGKHGYIEASYSYAYGALLYPYHGEELYPGRYKIEILDLDGALIATSECDVIIKDLDNIRDSFYGLSNIVFTDTPFNINDMVWDCYGHFGTIIPEINSLAAYCNVSNVNNANGLDVYCCVYREYYLNTYIDSGYYAQTYEEAENLLGNGNYETASIDELFYQIQVTEETTEPLTVYLYYYDYYYHYDYYFDEYGEFDSVREMIVTPTITEDGVFYNIEFEIPEDILNVAVYVCDENGDVMIMDQTFADNALAYQEFGFY